ncbi:MAG: GIY-YIG nuclease family protein [Clostridium sp.]
MVIYKIKNVVNGKLYIGQTVDYEERVRQHKQIPFRINSKENHKPLYRSMLKYGVGSFEFEIIDTAKDIDELNKKEVYYIEYYNSCIDNNKGYNLDKGGKNGRKSKVTKKKMGDSQRGELNHAYGKRGGDCHNAKPIINVTTNKIYPSMLDCAIEEYGDKKYLKQISKVCDPKSNRQTYKGDIYRLLDSHGNIVKKERTAPVNETFKEVKVIDTISGVIFNSISECAKYFKISDSMVRDRIYGRIKNDKYKTKFNLQIYSQL